MPTKGMENEGGANLVSPRWPLNKGDEKGSRARPSLHISSPSTLGSSPSTDRNVSPHEKHSLVHSLSSLSPEPRVL